MSEIKSIETKYNGYRFRSRLEARWAVFFDRIGIDYEYELEGITKGNKSCWLPDFFLPNIGTKGTYVEVKPFFPDYETLLKLESFALSGIDIFLISGTPGKHTFDLLSRRSMSDPLDRCEAIRCSFEAEHIDEYSHDDLKSALFDSWLYVTRCSFVFTMSSGWQLQSSFDGDWKPRLDDAIRKSRQARFEFGEAPKVQPKGDLK